MSVFAAAFCHFLLALAFLTRLAPARQADMQAMRAALAYYPLAGLGLGLFCTLPFALGLFASHALVQAWAYVFLSAWLTRALHLDGLADLLDALGSAKHGEAFFAVLKDSRLGAFGAVGISLTLLGYAALISAHCAHESYAPLIFAPIFGRCLPVLFARMAPPHEHASLGLLFSGLPHSAKLYIGPVLTLLGGLWLLGPIVLLLTLALSACALLYLRRVAMREGGYNGDYLGCAIIAGELAVFLAALP